VITPRMQAIIDCVSEKRVSDIGTDHAYIPIALIERSICEHVIACDIRPGPVEIAKRNVSEHNLSDKIPVRLGPGLMPIEENECNECIIAGMGGGTIAEILSQKTLPIKYILQPMNCQYELRCYLLNNGFKITKEELATEGFKVYNIICAEKGAGGMPSEIDLHLPKELYSHKDFGALLAKKKREFTKIRDGLKKSACGSEEEILKYEKLLSELNMIEGEIK